MGFIFLQALKALPHSEHMDALCLPELHEMWLSPKNQDLQLAHVPGRCKARLLGATFLALRM